jgi:hypothetical protein
LIKDSKKLVHNIFNLPQLAKLSNYKCFDKFRKELPKGLDRGIKDIFYKNRTIYIQVSHPTTKMELSYLAEELFNEVFHKEKSCEYMQENLLSVKVFIS